MLDMDKTKQIIAKAYAKRTNEIVRLHKDKWTLRAIGARFGLSYERVRQILDKHVKGVK